jgi:hypothetical protein
VQHVTGIPPERIEAYSLRSGGATALLCANIDEHVIQLLGRWKSDAMFRYLRTMAMPVTNHTSKAMLEHGHYTFAPTSPDTDLIPLQAPDIVKRTVAAHQHNHMDASSNHA